jgi:hypothetical protein
MSRWRIGKLLGHFLPETTAKYAHLADDVIADAAQRISGGLTQALGLKIMNALTLQKVVVEALADIGVNPAFLPKPKGRPRTTTWLGIEHGFGIRHYASGRNVYSVQTRMAGRVATITIGPTSVITKHQAARVARRVLAYAQVGADPAAERKRIRTVPRFDDFLDEFWRRWAPRWKPSTYHTQGVYREHYLDGAFPGIFIDALNEADITSWLADINNRIGPGGANRVMSILSSMMNRAEAWGYRLENTNPCRAVRPNKKHRNERFLFRGLLLAGISGTGRTAKCQAARSTAHVRKPRRHEQGDVAHARTPESAV